MKCPDMRGEKTSHSNDGAVEIQCPVEAPGFHEQ